MNKTTIWEILDAVYEQNPRAKLKVAHKTGEITIDGFGVPEPALGNLEELYKQHKSKTAKVLLDVVNQFLEKEEKK